MRTNPSPRRRLCPVCASMPAGFRCGRRSFPRRLARTWRPASTCMRPPWSKKWRSSPLPRSLSPPRSSGPPPSMGRRPLTGRRRSTGRHRSAGRRPLPSPPSTGRRQVDAPPPIDGPLAEPLPRVATAHARADADRAEPEAPAADDDGVWAQCWVWMKDNIHWYAISFAVHIVVFAGLLLLLGHFRPNPADDSAAFMPANGDLSMFRPLAKFEIPDGAPRRIRNSPSRRC